MSLICCFFVTLMFITKSDVILCDDIILESNVMCIFVDMISNENVTVNVIKHIGNGKYGDVWLARNILNAREYAIKQSIKCDDGCQNEMDIYLKLIKYHKQHFSIAPINYLPVYYVTKIFPKLTKIVVMKYIYHGTLSELFSKHHKTLYWSRMEPHDPLLIFAQFLNAMINTMILLQHISEPNIAMYNDWKFDNIVYDFLEDNTFQPYLIDFGLIEYPNLDDFRVTGNIIALSPLTVKRNKTLIQTYPYVVDMFGLIQIAVDLMYYKCMGLDSVRMLDDSFSKDCEIAIKISKYNAKCTNNVQNRKHLSQSMQVVYLKSCQISSFFWELTIFEDNYFGLFVKKIWYDVWNNLDKFKEYTWECLKCDINKLIRNHKKLHQNEASCCCLQ